MKLALNDVTITYGTHAAVQHVTMAIPEKSFFTLLGPSGSGKSTIMRAITGFNTVSQGEVQLDGQNITHFPPEKRAIGMVFQNYALFPTMRVYDNIAYGLRLQKLTKQAIDARVKEVAEIVQLPSDSLEKEISALSGGQQQRVAIARSLAPNPSLLLLDEPLSNLDARLRVALRRELKRLQNLLQMTIIYVTHDQSEALTLSDQIAVVNDGRIEQIGTPQAIYQTPATAFVANFIGDINRLGPQLVTTLALTLAPQAQAYIRPEHLTLDSGDFTISGVVREVEYFGSGYRYTLLALDTELTLITAPQALYAIGAAVTVYFNRSDVVVVAGDENASE